jgi:hypothetical protein
MCIGATEIGNRNQATRKWDQVRSLNGRIDELGVFARALSEEEIRMRYESGKPNP